MACIVEFSGKPGAGKSHACKELVDATGFTFPHRRVRGLFSSDTRTLKSYKKILACLYSLVFHFPRVLVIMKKMNQALSGRDKKRLVSSLVNAIYIDFKLRRTLQDSDVVILDQGFVQLCWANLHGENLDNIKSALLSLYSPYAEHRVIFVHIEASRNIFEASLQTRQDLVDGTEYRFKHLKEGSLLSLIGEVFEEDRFNLVKLHNDHVGRTNVEAVVSQMFLCR